MNNETPGIDRIQSTARPEVPAVHANGPTCGLSLLVAALLVIPPFAVQAVVIDFAGTLDGDYAIWNDGEYDISGFTLNGRFLFTIAGPRTDICSEGGCNTIDGESGQIADFFGGGAPVMTLYESSGNPFSLLSLDAAVSYLNLSSAYNASELAIVGYPVGGGSVSQSVSLGLGSTTMSFGAAWRNLSSVESPVPDPDAHHALPDCFREQDRRIGLTRGFFSSTKEPSSARRPRSDEPARRFVRRCDDAYSDSL